MCVGVKNGLFYHQIMVERAVLLIFDRKEGKDSEYVQRVRKIFKGVGRSSNDSLAEFDER